MENLKPENPLSRCESFFSFTCANAIALLADSVDELMRDAGEEQRRLEAAFTYSVSHDLKAPLRGIR